MPPDNNIFYSRDFTYYRTSLTDVESNALPYLFRECGRLPFAITHSNSINENHIETFSAV